MVHSNGKGGAFVCGIIYIALAIGAVQVNGLIMEQLV
jgi:hypothetical protein